MLAHDGRWWTASSDATSVRLPDSKGLRYLAELLRAPDVERHALDLVDRVEGVDPAVDRRRLGDAGPAADGAARAAYRRRIEALREEIADAEADGRHDVAEARHVELEALVGQLAQAFGLGGRDRPQASAAERARLNVTRALRSADRPPRRGAAGRRRPRPRRAHRALLRVPPARRRRPLDRSVASERTVLGVNAMEACTR